MLPPPPGLRKKSMHFLQTFLRWRALRGNCTAGWSLGLFCGLIKRWEISHHLVSFSLPTREQGGLWAACLRFGFKFLCRYFSWYFIKLNRNFYDPLTALCWWIWVGKGKGGSVSVLPLLMGFNNKADFLWRLIPITRSRACLLKAIGLTFIHCWLRVSEVRRCRWDALKAAAWSNPARCRSWGLVGKRCGKLSP